MSLRAGKRADELISGSLRKSSCFWLPRRNDSLFEQSNVMLERYAIARQTVTIGYINNSKQAQKPRQDWCYEKNPVS